MQAYNMRILYSTDVYDSTRVHRTDARWFYAGVTHEYMTNHRKMLQSDELKVGMARYQQFSMIYQQVIIA